MRARELVDRLLGAVDEPLRLAVIDVALRRDALARRDELTHAPLLVDGLSVRVDVGDERRGVQHFGEVRAAADLREALSVLQDARDLHDVDRLRALLQLEGRFEDAAMRFRVEVLGLEEDHFVERERIDHDRGEHSGLGVEIVRRNAAVDDRRRGILPRCSELVQHVALSFSTARSRK